jgi:hypothetical protein
MTLAIFAILGLLALGIALLAAGIYFMFWSRSDAKAGPTQAGLKDILTVNVPAQALLVLIGGIFFALGAWLAVTHNTSTQHTSGPVSPRTDTHTPAPTSTTFTAPQSPSTTPSSPTETIQIIRPKNGGDVKLNDTVTISVSGADMSRYVWLLVKLGSQVYPQGPCNNISLTITSCPGVRFGDPGMRVGTPYALTVVLVNAQGNSAYMPKVRNGFSSANPPAIPIASSAQITVHGLE